MASTSRSRSMSRDRYSREGRYRPRTSRSPRSPRSPTPRSAYSRSPVSDHRSSYNDGDPRGRSPPRSGSYRSRSYSRDRSPPRSSTRSESPYRPGASTKIVVERLTKNVNENHLWEIFGEYGEIQDLDLPLNRSLGTNRGTAYILYYDEADAEAAVAHMHEAELDGALINVSIVLPRRKISPPPPTARRRPNFDPLNPPAGFRPRSPPALLHGAPLGGSERSFGRQSDVYRPRSISRSRSRSPLPPPSGGRRYRSRSRSRSRSYVSRSRSRTPQGRLSRGGGGGGGRPYDNYEEYDDRRRSPTHDSYGDGRRS